MFPVAAAFQNVSPASEDYLLQNALHKKFHVVQPFLRKRMAQETITRKMTCSGASLGQLISLVPTGHEVP